MKKQILVMGCSMVLAATAMAGCSSNLNKATQPATEAPTTVATATEGVTTSPEAEAASGALSTGYAVSSTIGKSTDAGEKEGLAQMDTTFAAVVLDENGKIVDCKLDGVQTKINFSKEGKITTDLTSMVETKNELGEKYGMKVASKIGKEWNEQADAFAKYTIGKTIAEVKGIAVNDQGLAGDADLAASVTVHIGEFVGIVEQAAANAKSIGAQAGDKLGYGIVTNIAKSKDAAADGAGLAEAYSTYTVVTTGADGTITSCIIDGSQTDVNFDAAGKVTSDLKTTFQTKNQLGDAYGMKKASSIGKEWGQQAEAFAQYAVGKTAAEVSGVAVNEKGAPADADLTASVTIGIGDFQTVITKAADNAK